MYDNSHHAGHNFDQMRDNDLFDGIRVVGYRMPEVRGHHVLNAFMLHHFLQNDAVIDRLYTDNLSGFLDANQMENLGRAVGNCDHVRDLRMYSDGHDQSALELFFIWIAHNRSIEIFGFDFEKDVPDFFEHNHNLRCIEFLNFHNTPQRITNLISAISRPKTNRLARIDLCEGAIGDTKVADLINALNSMSGLSNLLDLWLEGNEIGKNGCRALFSLLKNPECRIMSLDLSSNPFDDECIAILVGGFVVCETLKYVSIGRHVSIGHQELLTVAGWKILSSYLSGPRCTLEKISLHQDKVADDSAAALGDALAMNKNLKCLDFSLNCITPTGWRGISICLAPPSSILELNLDETNINDEGAIFFFSALAINTTLKKLKLTDSWNITSAGWVSCFCPKPFSAGTSC